ncbi:KH domain [Cryptosporidium sp. chipmunk genotype I]|uniref:KH domain n=1 Tax=Cryptosporidium sp. chipmunk genotype I TaxID=1280935 RepID=UPI00351A8C9D|nr:KH domain [Cryptosporidium sp. chipmunk genotype I]
MMSRSNMERTNYINVQSEEEQIIFVKLLISDKAANRILGNSGSILKKIKQVNHVFILVSGTNKYFPGTNYRVATLEGNEKNVNETMEVLDFLLKNTKDDGQEESLKNYEYSIRLAVPRSVIGSIIGIKGEFISHVRTATSAHINISPIFVTSEKACNERIITISGNNSNQVIHAFIILTKKVNSSPEGRSCKSIIYRRADFFRRKSHKTEEERVDPLLCSQLEEMKNVLNGNPINSNYGVESRSLVTKEKPKLNFKTTSNGRWSEQVDLLAREEDKSLEKLGSELKQVEIIQQGLIEGAQIKICQQADVVGNDNNMQESLVEKLYEVPSKTVQERIPTNLFIISFLALVTGAFFLQYISSEIIRV